jgi:hypothetical protein
MPTATPKRVNWVESQKPWLLSNTDFCSLVWSKPDKFFGQPGSISCTKFIQIDPIAYLPD